MTDYFVSFKVSGSVMNLEAFASWIMQQSPKIENLFIHTSDGRFFQLERKCVNCGSHSFKDRIENPVEVECLKCGHKMPVQ